MSEGVKYDFEEPPRVSPILTERVNTSNGNHYLQSKYEMSSPHEFFDTLSSKGGYYL